MKPYAFISYSHKDARKVKEIASQLMKNHNLWMDEKLRHGKEYDPEIIRAIDNCTLFLLFASRDYIASEYCKLEYQEAFQRGIPVYIVLLEEYLDWDRTDFGLIIRFNNQHKDQFLDDDSLIEKLNDKSIADMYLCETDTPSNFAIHQDQPKLELPKQYGNQYTFMFKNKNNERIKLVGREDELKKLEGFTASDGLFAWTMIIGAAGTGKSKLCLEFAYKKHEEGWNVYFFNDGLNEKLSDLPNVFNRKTLIILDYTLSYTTYVSKFLKDRYDQQEEMKYKLRVLLVDRDYQTEEKEETKQPETNRMNIQLEYNRAQEFFPFLSINEASLKDSLYKPIPLFKMSKLSDEQLSDIMIHFVSQTTNGKKHLTQQEAAQLVNKLEKIDPDCTRPLFALFVADAWLQGNPLSTMQETLDIILSDEVEKRWLKQETNSKRDEYALKKAIKTILSYATICGTVQYDTARDVFVNEFNILCKEMQLDEEGLKKHLYRSRLMDKHNNVLAIRPDILGEYLVLCKMQEHPECMDNLLPKEWFTESSIRQFISNMYVDFETEILQTEEIKNKLFLGYEEMAQLSEESQKTYVNAIVELGYRTKQASVIAVQILSYYYNLIFLECCTKTTCYAL